MDEGQNSTGFVVVGRVLAPWGVHGELRVEVHSDAPGRFDAGGVLFVQGQPFTIGRAFSHKRSSLVLRLDGIETGEQAEALRGKWLEVPQEQVPPLPRGRYYHFQLMGMRVYTVQDQYLGVIDEILATGANDVYLVREGGKEVLIPALEEVIKEVDVENGIMRVELMEGLL